METSPSDNRPILLVSSDGFIEGLVRGYCLANHLDLEVRSPATGVIGEETGARPRLLIVDRRSFGQPAEDQPAAVAATLEALSRQTHTPLCIISDTADALGEELLSEHHCVIGEPLAEQLDRCLRKYTGRDRHAFSERRRQDRREWRDRRCGARTLPRAVPPAPFPPREPLHAPGCYSVGPFAIDPDGREVTMHNRGLFLSTKEFQLFHLLASNVGSVLAADRIILELWPENSRANKSDLYQYIHLLRRKIEADPQRPRWLVTVKGVGYQLRTRVTTAALRHQVNL